jgi:hypothetical protein
MIDRYSTLIIPIEYRSIGILHYTIPFENRYSKLYRSIGNTNPQIDRYSQLYRYRSIGRSVCIYRSNTDGWVLQIYRSKSIDRSVLRIDSYKKNMEKKKDDSSLIIYELYRVLLVLLFQPFP